MNFSDRFIHFARAVLPSPFSIAIILTVVIFVFGLIFNPEQTPFFERSVNLLEYWEMGFWDFLAFSMQMVLILVLGHALALSKPVAYLIESLLFFCTNTANAVLVLTFLTINVALFNWGLGLIFGALFARKIGDYAIEHGYKINYPLIGAAAYSGLMVWHGGLSGSAPLKVASDGVLLEGMSSPVLVSTASTIFSPMNVTASLLLMVILPLALYFIGKASRPTQIIPSSGVKSRKQEGLGGAERLDYSRLFARSVAVVMLGYMLYKVFIRPDKLTFDGVMSQISLNSINFVLFGMGLLFHGSIYKFVQAVEEAVTGATGIILQFPLYAGITGMMTHSGLLEDFSQGFIAVSSQNTLPLNTFFSAGIVNIFVPSGGGQWIVQGPVIMEAARELDVSYAKQVIALAYGDQLTNMLQPFWALPLLGITGLKARDILPYTFILFILGFLVFGSCLMIF